MNLEPNEDGHYVCPECSYTSATSHGAKIHFGNAHEGSIAGTEAQCQRCGNKFTKQSGNENKYCSPECYHESKVTQIVTKCSECGTWISKTKSKFQLYNNHFCSTQCKARAVENENNPRWNGGSSDWFRSPSGKAWRQAVFERDEYTCQDCGEKGCRLNAHHIKYRSNCEINESGIDEAYAVWNGVTLCKMCHAERHKDDRFYPLMRSSV